MRTFIAIELDAQIKEHLKGLIVKFKAFDCDVRWIKPQGMHLTIKFLGEVSPEKISEIARVMNTVCPKYPAFPLRLEGTGAFPPGSKKPRVVWIGVETNQSLLSLQKDLEVEMEKFGFPREKRTYHPHLTLGRIKSDLGIDPLLSGLENYRHSKFGSMNVKEVILFKSILKPTGAEYTKLIESKLA